MKRLCVFCGSSVGGREEYSAAARELGRLVAGRGMSLVYGGGHVGLMGVLADAALEAGGKVIGVIPEALEQREIAHRSLTELRIVRTMHERKAMMADLSDGFVALPGGIGTLDELCEIVTWAVLGIHGKPIGLLNVQGYFNPLLGFFNEMVVERFFKPAHRSLIVAEEDPAALLDRIRPPR